MSWPVEEIPDEAGLFYRVHHGFADPDGKPTPGAFHNNPKSDPNAGMSVNWDKYSTAEEARQGTRKPATEYAIVKLNAGKVRKLPNQTVVHEPFDDNSSHSEVFGEKNTEVRAKLLEMYEPILDFDPVHRRAK
jgi:hypothetical protein